MLSFLLSENRFQQSSGKKGEHIHLSKDDGASLMATRGNSEKSEYTSIGVQPVAFRLLSSRIFIGSGQNAHKQESPISRKFSSKKCDKEALETGIWAAILELFKHIHVAGKKKKQN